MRPLFDPFAASSRRYPANTATQKAETAKQRQNRSTSPFAPRASDTKPSGAVLTQPRPEAEMGSGQTGRALVANYAAGEAHQGRRKNDSHGRYVTFQMAEVAVPRMLFAEILRLIALLRPPPDPASA